MPPPAHHAPPPRDAAAPAPASTLGEVAAVFLKLGVLGFGGPAAHIAMMRQELVVRRRWMEDGEFLEFLGAANLLPGPTSTELALHMGHRRAGGWGLAVAGTCFIVPPALMVGAAAWGYVRYGSVPQVAGVLYGIKAVVIAVVAHALWGLVRSGLGGAWQRALAVAAALAFALGVPELSVLALAAVAGAVRQEVRARTTTPLGLVAWGVPAAGVAAGPAVGAGGLFVVFLKIGSVLFGSGYVLLAFLRSELVVRLGWLTERQLLDAVAVGQMTPGPLFTTATFIGYLLGGAAGAAAATAGIFLPAFAYVGASGWLLPRLRRSARAGAMLEGVTVASLALMAVVAAQLAHAAVVDAATAAIAVVSVLVLLRWRDATAWLVVLGAVIGGIVYRG